MNKRSLHHYWVKIKKLHYWHFLFLTLVFGLISVFSLRQNNLTALKLRDEVLKVDQQNGDVELALRRLRTYIYGHMNTNLASSTSVYPPIQLKYRYERLVQAENDRVSKVNGDLYNSAQQYCERTEPSSFYGAGRLGCIQSYLDSHPSATQKPVENFNYKFDFTSPSWSPDLAGWSLVLSGLFMSLFFVRYGLEVWFKNKLKHHS